VKGKMRGFPYGAGESKLSVARKRSKQCDERPSGEVKRNE
jgi:hypothetical protein